VNRPLALIDCCAPLAAPALDDEAAGELERLFRALGDRERRGTFAYYRLAPGALARLRDVFADA
jgi:hypothetical protein